MNVTNLQLTDPAHTLNLNSAAAKPRDPCRSTSPQRGVARNRILSGKPAGPMSCRSPLTCETMTSLPGTSPTESTRWAAAPRLASARMAFCDGRSARRRGSDSSMPAVLLAMRSSGHQAPRERGRLALEHFPRVHPRAGCNEGW